MIELTSDEILALCKARDILDEKQAEGRDRWPVSLARRAINDVLVRTMPVPRPTAEPRNG